MERENDAKPAWLAAYSGRRVLVTGASGFIGRWVARLLTSAGADLSLIARDAAALDEICDAYRLNGRSVIADLAQTGAFARVHQQIRPHATFNLAGYGVESGERDDSLLVALNEQLIREIAGVVSQEKDTDWPGLRLVHVGSGAEYGSIEAALVEDAGAAPISPYGRAKLAGTRALAAICGRTGLRAVAARAFTVYGPGEHAGRLLPSLLEARRTGEPVDLTTGEQRRDFTFVGDVAEGLLRFGAVADPVPRVVNLATGTLTSVREFAECAAELLALPAAQLRFGALPTRNNELHHGPPDLRLLRRTLGWMPSCSIRDGIRATIEFESRSASVKG